VEESEGWHEPAEQIEIIVMRRKIKNEIRPQLKRIINPFQKINAVAILFGTIFALW